MEQAVRLHMEHLVVIVGDSVAHSFYASPDNELISIDSIDEFSLR